MMSSRDMDALLKSQLVKPDGRIGEVGKSKIGLDVTLARPLNGFLRRRCEFADTSEADYCLGSTFFLL